MFSFSFSLIISFCFFFSSSMLINWDHIFRCEYYIATLPVDVISVKWLCNRYINHSVGHFTSTFSLLAVRWNFLSNSGNFFFSFRSFFCCSPHSLIYIYFKSYSFRFVKHNTKYTFIHFWCANLMANGKWNGTKKQCT